MFAAPLPSFPLRFERYGDEAHLAHVGHVDPAYRADLIAYLRAHPSVADAMVTEEHALVVRREGHTFDEHHAYTPGSEPLSKPRHHAVALRFGGPDSAEAARVLGLTEEALARAYMEITYTVSFLGFLPGFAYLRGLPKALELPRRAQIRPRVPASSFAVGGPYVGIYPEVSPGGWWLLGEAVAFTAFVREGADAGPVLRVGDTVRFVEAAR
jgi:KipI family sensor histidine kinase inhibitor